MKSNKHSSDKKARSNSEKTSKRGRWGLEESEKPKKKKTESNSITKNLAGSVIDSSKRKSNKSVKNVSKINQKSISPAKKNTIKKFDFNQKAQSGKIKSSILQRKKKTLPLNEEDKMSSDEIVSDNDSLNSEVSQKIKIPKKSSKKIKKSSSKKKSTPSNINIGNNNNIGNNIMNFNFYQNKEKDLNNKNYENVEELKFLKDLSIILEGHDYCSATGWKENAEVIYVTSNKLGNLVSKNPSHGIQDLLIQNVIDFLKSKKIDKNDFDSLSPVLEILLANIIFNTIQNKSIFYENEEERIKLLRYLHIFFMGKRPKRSLRMLLNIQKVIKQPKTQNRIKRFVKSFLDILDSKILPKIKSEEIRIEKIHMSHVNVHAELKIMDRYILQDEVLDHREEGKIFIAPSRKPCQRCKFILENFNKKKYKIKLLFPVTNLTSFYKFVKPEFMRSSSNKKHPELFDLLNKFEEKILLTVEKKIDSGEQKIIDNSKTTDKYNSIYETNKYSFDEKGFKSTSYDFNIFEIVGQNILKNIKVLREKKVSCFSDVIKEIDKISKI